MARLTEAINAVYGRFVDGNDTPTISEPIQSRLEAILWNLAGADASLPTAEGELEEALAELAEHADEIGGGGGSSDYTSCTLTLTLVEGSYAVVPYWYSYEDEDDNTTKYCASGAMFYQGAEPIELNVILYKGEAELSLFDTGGGTVTASGNIRDFDGNWGVITGDCTVTVGAK